MNVVPFAGALSGQFRVHPSDLKMFTPFDCPLSEGEGLRRVLDAFYSTNSSETGTRASEALVAASSTYSLSVCQAVITALVCAVFDSSIADLCVGWLQASCTDNQLRMDALGALRAYLKRLEERSLFGLLLRLIDQCPFLSITGMRSHLLNNISIHRVIEQAC